MEPQRGPGGQSSWLGVRGAPPEAESIQQVKLSEVTTRTIVRLRKTVKMHLYAV